MIEGYVESLEDATRALDEGATRLELCGPGEGGLTPSEALLGAVRAACCRPIHVMIRPRPGDFVYTAAELDAMRHAIEAAARAGAEGVVLGVLLPTGALDIARMAELVALARPLRVVCHRAFDRTPDADAALGRLIALGVDGVLTAGHASTASDGAAQIARHVRRAAQADADIEIIAGGSVRGATVGALVAATAVAAVHARATEPGTIAAIAAVLAR
jgi:copper homeostasis protein